MNNRELSWILFNERVLQEAQDESVPLIQRLRFLGIFSNNQDEFFKVRVANLIRLTGMKIRGKPSQTDYAIPPKELLPLIYKRIDMAQNTFMQTFEKIIIELREYGVYIIDHTELNETQRKFCLNYFLSVVSVRLVPLMLRKSAEMPFLHDGRAYLAIKMSKETKSNARYSVVEIPVSESSPRFVVLPSENQRTDIIFVDDIIRMFLDDIFFMFNYDNISAHSFKIMRDGLLPIDDDVSKGFVEKMEQGITDREHGRAVRLVYDRDMPPDFLELLADKLELYSTMELEGSRRYHSMRDLMKFPKIRPELENINPEALIHPAIDPMGSIFKVIKKQDILLYYPFHTFKHFIDILREAAVDPRVESINITLYRTAERSKVINALCNAARNGKQVTALVELKARFDEEHNIDNTNELQQAGVKVIHPLESLKVHCKLLLIERREGKNENTGYLYIGTGNFNEKTAELYCDFGFFTSNQTLVHDARKVFDFLVNPHKRHIYRHLLVSPHYLRREIEKMIEAEIKHAKAGKKAFFYGKFNTLTDERMIALLYRASKAGVLIRLIIRGACCLQPGIKGLSETVEVRSIVDKYLEHGRMAIHCNGGNPNYYIFSADLMARNLDRRIEVSTPIFDEKIQKTLSDIFEIQWSDNVKARSLTDSENNIYVKGDGESIRSQIMTYDYFKNDQRDISRD